MTRGKLPSVRGTVVSDRMEKTIVVKTERRVKHPRYGKYIRRYTTYYAHDEENQAKTGDIVELAFTRPISKSKRWRLTKVVTAYATGSGTTGTGTTGTGTTGTGTTGTGEESAA